MWTNVFRIGGLHHISWFQLLPSESDSGSFIEKSAKVEQRDAATFLVLSSHVQLQSEGFLSAWTNSFVGPWDPSQGVHNPDEKIKLWLFLPGKHSAIVEAAQPAVSKLRVVATGLWSAPGDSEEVAFALSQALKNRIERTLRGFFYVRFGDVFSKVHSSAQNDRRVFPSCEFVFAATEDAIFVHAVISAKRVRMLSGDDLERVLRHRSSVKFEDKLPVIVSPHGMRGRLTGCCPGDLVKHVCSSKSKGSSGSLVASVPPSASQSSYCMLRGHNCYAEVSLDFPYVETERTSQDNTSSHVKVSRHDVVDKAISGANGKGEQKQGSSDHIAFLEKAFVYPAEAVLVPVPQTILARSSLRRFWFRDFADATLLDTGALLDLFSSLPTRCCSSSRNSNSSSCTSSLSTTSSDSECARGNQINDIEADADSLACKEFGLTSSNQCGADGQTVVSKRARVDAESFDQHQPYKVARKGYEFSTKGFPCSEDGAIHNEFKQECGLTETNTASGILNATINHLGTYWHWDDDDAGVVLDVQTLLSEFGDFSDLFQNDVLPFGEPPSAAESEAFMFPLVDGADMIGSPTIDVSDQALLPVDLSPCEGLHQTPLSVKETNNRNQETVRDTPSSVIGSCTSLPTTGEFDHLSKSEAMMIFAPQYTAVETSDSDCSSLFRNPYVPVTKKVETSSATSSLYAYSATPPPSNVGMSEDIVEASGRPKEAQPRRDSRSAEKMKHYSHVCSGSSKSDRVHSSQSNIGVPYKTEGNFSSLSDFKSSNASLSLSKGENFIDAGSFIFSLKSMLATEVECLMLQASMCRTRHTLLSFNNLAPPSMNKLAACTVVDHPSRGTSALPGKISRNLEVKKADSVPVRISGEMDGGVLDGNHSAPIGVWRSVGAPRGVKPSITPNNDAISPLRGAFEEESMVSNGQRQQIKVLIDALGLLVQQSASFVDLSLDTDCGDGPYGWLAFEEQKRRGFSCGPYMVHAGCGGLLSSCHSLDNAGVELPDPLSAEVYPSSVASLLQTDLKLALKSAFGDRNIDGPLLVTDWCKSHNQVIDGGVLGDGYSAECGMSETRDTSTSVGIATGEPISPSLSSTSGPSVLRDGVRLDESIQRKSNQEPCGSEMEQQTCHARPRSTVMVLPVPAILLGYQDDWLKISANAIQLWEKAPFEPYALPKPVNYYVACPDIDILAAAASDFFLQLGTVYEACKLGSHTPQTVGSQTGLASGKWSSSGFLLVDCPHSVAKAGCGLSLLNSINEYVMSVSRDWDLDSYCNSLCKVLKAIRLGPTSTSPKEGSGVPCTVIYIVCPFPSCSAILRTLIEASAAIGSVFHSHDKDKRSSIHAQVEKALTLTTTADETSVSSIVTLAGFSVSKLVLQIVTLENILKVNRPPLTEQITLKEMAFTVYNKARRTQRKVVSHAVVQSTTFSSRPQSAMTQITSPVPGIWKDSRTTGPSLPREGGLDGSLRSGSWDNSWLPSRPVESNCDLIAQGESAVQEEFSYLFEPLFILAEAGSVEHGVPSLLYANAASESTRSIVDDGSGMYMQMSNSSGSVDTGPNAVIDGSDMEMLGSSNQKVPSLHCSYGWTEDWRWLVCIWTDSRGELLDSHVFPFGGISSRQDTMGLQQLFMQLLQLGCQICSSSDSSGAKPRDIVISRIGCFYELECQEWQKAILAVGGGEVKKWPLQLRQSISDGNSTSSNGSSLQQQDLSLIQERTLPSSPNPSLYGCQSKSPGYMKSGIPQASMRKQLLSGPSMMESSRGALHWVQSISLIGICVDHSLRLVLPADTSGSASSGGNGGPGTLGLEGFGPVRSLGLSPSTYVLIPSPCMRFLPPMPMQLPTTLTSESPPLAHLLHSKGFAVPLATGFVVSKSVTSTRRDSVRNCAKDEWPSVLSVSLVDYYGGHCTFHDKAGRTGNISKQARSPSTELRDTLSETHQILERLSAEIHALSWMTVSPAYMERRTALPFHCDMLQRLRRLLHHADKELCQLGKLQTV
ncbi:mediator of RNA polymerase II transcription subunit 13 [Nymphaea colorata]|nr:mediator of RNA polymerase II transcription subunit 13 [Nymphaea colorata]XP_031502552.1 mediator of RNA polymerase II transcription subunit 13 [Nymphaea colorata]XP_031502553.1 mediator of RNA polymerase II transcription subunit 13 [Nymphaea colorata]